VSLSYALRLLSISLSSFFLVHTLLSAALNLAAPRAIRFAANCGTRFGAKLASSFLFAYRLAPPTLASLAVLLFCVPSYLWLEPPASTEEVGLPCLILAVLGAAICLSPLARIAKVLADSARFSKACQARGHQTRFRGDSSPVWVVPRMSPLLAVSGILRQEVFISADLLRTLSHSELSAALRHERAHRLWRDNLKRLLLLSAPRALPASRGLVQVERAWSKFTEWAADDLAVAGDPRRAVSLASAIVRVARLGSAAPHPAFLSSLVEGCELEERVERLLHVASAAGKGTSRGRLVLFAASCVLAAASTAYFFGPAVLLAAHELLERLIA
jgi:Zn-dependent protease with chaperone function